MKKIFLFLVCISLLGFARAQNPTDKLLEFFNILNFSYVDTFNFNKLSEKAIISMLAELDPHSLYIPADKVQEMNESLQGEYEGIGVQFDMYKDTVLVVSVVHDGPSYVAGMISGDKIIKADGEAVSGEGLSDSEIISRLRGESGSVVKLEIKRRNTGSPVHLEIKRGKIPISSVDASYMLDKETGYIKINRFSRNTFTEFKAAIKELKDQNVVNLVLDLRDNGGGYLVSAVNLADEFLVGRKEIVTTKGLRQSQQVYRSDPGGIFQEGRLVVLINEGTASASEIFAGAIQDWDRGIIMGRRSFGKGLVMKPYTFSDGSMMRLTTSKYYTPSGRCIQKEYGASKDTYDNEIFERSVHGELFSEDSIEISRDLIYKTAAGRTVYGGGGIIPDIFVPADTILSSDIFQEIFKSGAFIDYSMDFTEKNRVALSAYKYVNSLIRDSVLGKTIVQGFEQHLMDKEIIKAPLDEITYPYISRQLLAFVSRNLWDDSQYHRAINSNQAIINKALQVINNKEFNWDELSDK